MQLSESLPDTIVVALSGEIDMANAAQITAAAAAACESGCRTLVYDAAGVTFMDSQGVDALLAAYRSLQEMGGDVILRRPPRSVRLVLGLLGVDRVLRVD